MLEKQAWLHKKHDALRRALLAEPRGYADLCGAVLTEPISPGAHAGLLFMHNDGYSPLSGHAVIAATTIALERDLLMPGGDGRTIVYDTPAGIIRAVATRGGDRVERVAFVNLPSFVLAGGVVVKLGSRHVRADVAFGGAFFAIVDSEAAGVPIARSHLHELRRTGMAIKDAIEAARPVVHPLAAGHSGLHGTVFTGPPHGAGADLRGVTVFADSQIDPSPGGCGLAAVMAVVDAMGLLGGDRPFVQEGMLGTRFEARVVRRTTVGELEAIVPEISGEAW